MGAVKASSRDDVVMLGGPLEPRPEDSSRASAGCCGNSVTPSSTHAVTPTFKT